MKNITINGFNNLELNTYLFDEVQNPKASILIIHGMQEHGGRYLNFANFLQKNGFIVLVSDLRGHGLTAKSKDDFGKGNKDIFSEIVEDQKILAKYLEDKFSCPLYVFGHSYGSFITQKLLQVYPSIQKAIICGTTNGDSGIIDLGRFLSNILMKFGKQDNRESLVQKMSLNSYGKGFEDGNWLTRDSNVWEEYKKDELCGNPFPLSFYNSMLNNLHLLNKNISHINKETDILFIVGSKDPVSSGAKHVISLHKLYVKKGLNASIKIYDDCRHELLNEINKEEVYNDILDFYK